MITIAAIMIENARLRAELKEARDDARFHRDARSFDDRTARAAFAASQAERDYWQRRAEAAEEARFHALMNKGITPAGWEKIPPAVRARLIHVTEAPVWTDGTPIHRDE